MNPGVNEMLVGATGSGKTYAIRTLVDAGLEVFVVATEPAQLPRPQAVRWANYWGTEDGYGRMKRREDRGDDPELRRRTRDGG